jgi:DNA-directed RNA polymerase subunit RPC12/RpoP
MIEIPSQFRCASTGRLMKNPYTCGSCNRNFDSEAVLEAKNRTRKCPTCHHKITSTAMVRNRDIQAAIEKWIVENEVDEDHLSEFHDHSLPDKENIPTFNIEQDEETEKESFSDVDGLDDPNQDYWNLFLKWDKEKKGYLTVNELNKGMNSAGNRFDENEIRDMFVQADSNGDGKLTYEEFVAQMNTMY